MIRSRTYGSTKNHANRIQNTLKRKSVAADIDNEKKETKEAATSYQGQSSTRFSCGICFDSVKVYEMFTNPSCNHPFCTKCISKHVKLQRKEKVLKLNCPDPECSLELKPELFQSILPTQVIEEWEFAIYESSISLKQKIYCPYKNCSVMMVNDGKKLLRKSKKGQDEKQLDEKFSELAKREKWQKCPKCYMHVQRKGECEHISCRCGCNFCYMCGKDWIHGHVCKYSQ